MADTAPMLPSIDSLPGRTIGGYVVKQRLSEGGMGMVYLAEHQVGKRAAVKFLRPEVAYSAEWTARFLTEARALAALKHGNLVNMFEFGETSDGFQYLMMEFIEGITLERYLHEQSAKGRLPLVPAQALGFADQILNGLGEAHKKGIVHRDLKPANIMKASEHDGKVVLKIVDFGLARQDPVNLLEEGADRAHRTSLLAGTPEYIAPEQARGLRGDGRADLYAVGVMLYEMLSGQLPFKAKSVLELMKMHAFEPPPPLALAVGGLPEGVSDFVHQLLEKNPDDRPASADVARLTVHRLLKALERDATSIKPMPSKPVPSMPAPLVSASTTEELIALSVPPRRRGKAIAVAVAIALLLLLWLLLPIGGKTPIVAARQVAPPAEVVPEPEEEPIAVVPAAAPPPKATSADTELSALKKHRPVAPRLTIQAPECFPDDEWKKGVRATLNELAARASKMKSAELVLWADGRERTLSAAIASATSRSDCSVVDAQLADFKEKLKIQ